MFIGNQFNFTQTANIAQQSSKRNDISFTGPKWRKVNNNSLIEPWLNYYREIFEGYSRDIPVSMPIERKEEILLPYILEQTRQFREKNNPYEEKAFLEVISELITPDKVKEVEQQMKTIYKQNIDSSIPVVTHRKQNAELKLQGIKFQKVKAFFREERNKRNQKLRKIREKSNKITG